MVLTKFEDLKYAKFLYLFSTFETRKGERGRGRVQIEAKTFGL